MMIAHGLYACLALSIASTAVAGRGDGRLQGAGRGRPRHPRQDWHGGIQQRQGDVALARSDGPVPARQMRLG